MDREPWPRPAQEPRPSEEPRPPEQPRPAPAPGREPAPAPGSEPVLPEQSREDTDAGWGEYPRADDDRLTRDRPPHWDDF